VSQQDRIWSDFNLGENCVHIADENQARLYLAQITLALRALERITKRNASDSLEARAMEYFVERLESTFRLLSLKHFFASADVPLKIDTTDSGFFHFSTLLDLQADLKARDALLKCMLTVPALKAEMVDRLVRFQQPVRDLQQQLAKRLFLEALVPEDVFEPFVSGPLVPLVGEDKEHTGFWSFATYDRGLNRPFVYLIYFVYDRGEPLREDSDDFRGMVAEAARLASGQLSLLAFSNQLDAALERVHPRSWARTGRRASRRTRASSASCLKATGPGCRSPSGGKPRRCWPTASCGSVSRSCRAGG